MSAPATDVAPVDQTAAPAVVPQTNEQKAKAFAEKHGVVNKVKAMIYKKLGLKPKAATAAH
ncbi:hypothetical protein Q9L58_006579 [Maublancomyces gigas]|uniref:Uncharacterized protein n=1 Tax=Discina gigas TaxID=1032678 RepID=A0ABR3GEZ1_9PEZI